MFSLKRGLWDAKLIESQHFMSPSKHTYGPTCRLSQTAATSSSAKEGDIPPINPHFFYLSPLPIDDPLTAVPTPSGSESKSSKHDPRPFSAHDNNGLEEAWLGLACEKDRRQHEKLKNHPLYPLTKAQTNKRSSPVQELPTKHKKSHVNDDLDGTSGKHDHVKNLVLEDKNRKGPKTACTVCPSPPTKSHECSSSLSSSPQILVTTATSSRSTAISKGSSSLARNNNAEDINKNAKLSEQTGIAATPTLVDDTSPLPHSIEDPQHTGSGLPSCCFDLEQGVESQQNIDVTGILGVKGSGGDLTQEVLAQNKKQESESENDAKLDGRLLEKKHGSDQRDATYETLQKNNQSPATSMASADKRTGSSASKTQRAKEPSPSEIRKYSKDPRRSREILAAHSPKQLATNHQVDSSQGITFASGSSETGTTGFPFKRAPSRKVNLGARTNSPSPSSRGNSTNECEVCSDSSDDLDDSHRRPLSTIEPVRIHGCKAHKKIDDDASVPVGISRLHLVKLPVLQMMPIYWSPVHDIAVVTRGTWFYSDTMYPVEPPLANQLEIGYRELRPWSQTWNDELNSAVEVGAAGEEKISHRIWPKETDKSDAKDDRDQIAVAADPYCAARCFHGEVAATGAVYSDQPEEKNSQMSQITKRFPNSHVIYKDARNAFILKPNLQPSEYYGRKPLAKIRKGIAVGIHVVRGFDWRAWEKVHSSKKPAISTKVEDAAPVAGSANASKRAVCSACCEHDEGSNVTDLVFVIHGIGQKLSERVESFHFTHAINAFRRSTNIELGNDAVRNVCRKDLGGIMVLPINWRSTLSFEDGGPLKDGDKSKEVDGSDFTLKDITPDTIPAVRNLISDVMLDIPFYMSHHKPKMIEALVTEANRLYRLWCQNNPKFQHKGRVHIIAHSLGSAMALDVLSKQPTSIGHVDLSKKVSTRYFEFDTKNLFFVGSPAGFFLLLNKGKLMPRKDRNKPGIRYGDDKEKDVVGEAATFGCLAVDNLYNVMHYSDPIAYRLNGAVDPVYASTLKNARVPNATIGWLESIGNVMRGMKPGTSITTELGVGQLAKPVATRLPSQLEMEVHDFSREEVAEKKFYLLNDNGQIDYFLSTGGGPLEIQYLNMLSAHSSYWGSPDFVRMIVTEVGRKPGRSNTLPNMKAVKRSHR